MCRGSLWRKSLEPLQQHAFSNGSESSQKWLGVPSHDVEAGVEKTRFASSKREKKLHL
jgi:hypothetical protein